MKSCLERLKQVQDAVYARQTTRKAAVVQFLNNITSVYYLMSEKFRSFTEQEEFQTIWRTENPWSRCEATAYDTGVDAQTCSPIAPGAEMMACSRVRPFFLLS